MQQFLILGPHPTGNREDLENRAGGGYREPALRLFKMISRFYRLEQARFKHINHS